VEIGGLWRGVSRREREQYSWREKKGFPSDVTKKRVNIAVDEVFVRRKWRSLSCTAHW